MNARDALKSLRLLNCFLAGLAVWIGASVASHSWAFSWTVLMAAGAGFLVCGAGQAINDYFDFELDLKKGKPKFSSITSKNKKQLLLVSLLLFAVGNELAFLVNPVAFDISVGITFLLVVYSALLARQKFLGNLVVALGTALPLVFGAAVFGKFEAIIWLATSAFFANWGREIVKDSEDLLVDRGQKITLPMFTGKAMLKAFLALLLLLAGFFAYIPLIMGLYGNLWFFIGVSIANIFFLKAYWDYWYNNPKSSQRIFKVAMAIALLGFLAGLL